MVDEHRLLEMGPSSSIDEKAWGLSLERKEKPSSNAESPSYLLAQILIGFSQLESGPSSLGEMNLIGLQDFL